VVEPLRALTHSESGLVASCRVSTLKTLQRRLASTPAQTLITQGHGSFHQPEKVFAESHLLEEMDIAKFVIV
jgi:hypothetical protein